MGTRGPIPKRNAERRRRNTEGKAETIRVAGAVKAPALPPGVNPLARRWYLSLKRSGQSQHFEPSDWTAAMLVVEQLTRLLESDKPVSGKDFAAVWSAMNDLLTTEAARRRARIEVARALEQHEEQAPGITAISAFRQRMAQEAAE